MSLCRLSALLLMLACGVTAQAEPGVMVDINGQPYKFSTPVRLTELMEKVQQPQQVYWPAAAVFVADDGIEQQKYQLMQALLQRLAQLSEVSQDRADLARFIAVLSGMKIARRLDLTVDYERSRRVFKYNPLFSDGRYYLTAKPVPTAITLLGAVRQQQIPLNDEQVLSAREVHQQFAADGADDSFLYWSFSGENWQRTGIAYWNNAALELPATAVVYIPFSSAVIGPDHDTLNQQILFVLRHWVR